MSEFQHIAYHQHENMLAIIFNRPDVMNALSPPLIEEFLAALNLAASDESVEVVIVTGAGKAWSAGIDLKALQEGLEKGDFDAKKVNEDGSLLYRCNGINDGFRLYNGRRRSNDWRYSCEVGLNTKMGYDPATQPTSWSN